MIVAMKKTLALLLLLAGLSVEAQGRTLYWTGGYSIYWNDLESHINWKDKDGKDTFYQEGDDVVFHNCDASYVEVWGVSPGSMLVDNSAGNSYTFDRDASGGGSINGNMNLTKRGEGDLTFECACKYTGDTFIYGGTTSINDERPSVFGDEEPARLGYGDIFLCGGRLELFSLSQPYANNIYVKGEATLNCQYLGGSLTVQNTGKLTLDAPLNGRGGNLILQDGAMVNVGGYAVSFYGGAGTGGLIAVEGNATLGNGLIISCKLNVAAGKTLTLMANTSATNGTNFNLGEGSSLDMGGNNVNFTNTTVSSSGDGANLGHGTITGVLSLTASSRINLLENTTVTGGVTLGDNALLDLGKNAISASVTLSGSSATIGNGTINGDMTVAEGKSLALLANTTVTGGVSLGAQSSLNLGGNTHSGNVSLGWNTAIGNGSVNGDITFAAGNQQLSLCGDLGGTGDIAIGVVNKNSSSPIGIDPPHPVFTSSLDMGGHTLSKGLKLVGDTTVSNGRLVLAHDMTRSLDDIQARTVTIGAETTVDLNSHTFSHNLAVEADTAIGNGTIGGNVTVDEGKSVRFFGETKIDSNNEGLVSYHGKIKIGGTTIQALHRPLESQIGAPVYPGLMKELTVSENEILGTGRASSLADGLEIQSEADLLIKGMTITADNKISVGDNTITLNNVTIKLSEDYFDRENPVDGVYYFKLQDLFHCDVEFNNVVFDASGLELPEGFDPGVNGIGMDFGPDVTIDPQPARSLTLLMGGDWSQTMNLVDGKPVFTALVPTPEPTTGTLSLLALAALAARRRRK